MSKIVGILCHLDAVGAQKAISRVIAEFGLHHKICESFLGLDAAIVLSRVGDDIDIPDEIPSLHLQICSEKPAAAEVVFSANLAPEPFSGRRITTNFTVPAHSSPEGAVIATSNGFPIWTTIRGSEHRRDWAIVEQDWCSSDHFVFERFNGRTFMNYLPLVEWIRCISGYGSWKHPSPRACFVFDDPNLHSKRYGFIDFEKLAVAGLESCYHSAFATVPLDSYYVSAKAANIFRSNRKTLSLLIHGNNHTSKELSSFGSLEMAAGNMVQALARIERLERRSKLAVSRVMAPPHGACSEETMEAMVKAGFQAACISHGSLRAANPSASWTESLGLSSVVVIKGLPIIPRFPISSCSESTLLLSVYLHQPIIPMGHHEDLSGGFHSLSAIADQMNRLGATKWTSMAEIAETNFSSRTRGNALEIWLRSRCAKISIPQDKGQLIVHAPWTLPEDCLILRSPGNQDRLTYGGDGIWVLELRASGDFLLEVERQTSVPNLPNIGFNIRGAGRRVLCEIRDRAKPYIALARKTPTLE